MQYIAYAVTALSIIGTIANGLQKRWCFWVWGFTNAFWCVFNITNGSYAQAILYAFNFAMAIVGIVKWRKQKTRIPKKLVKEINEALNIELLEWQIQYIFNDGEYHSDGIYGRQNGKTTANILKLLFSKGIPLRYDERCGILSDVTSQRYAKEDAVTIIRMKFFTSETLKIYNKLRAAGIKNLRPILDINNFDLYFESYEYKKELSQEMNEEEMTVGW